MTGSLQRFISIVGRQPFRVAVPWLCRRGWRESSMGHGAETGMA